MIQYVPDPVADERINVGVLVFDENRVRARFLKGWGRLDRLGRKDVSFLKPFAEEITDRCEATLFTDGQIDAEMIRRAAATWRDSIQLTEPGGSPLNLDALCEDAEGRFLGADRPRKLRLITTNSLRKLVLDEAKIAFGRKGAPPHQFVRASCEIAGSVEPHRFSLTIANGHPHIAAEVFSFIGIIDQRGQERDVRAGAWAFNDVRKRNPNLPLAAWSCVTHG